MSPDEEVLLPVPGPRSAADGPPRGVVAAVLAVVLGLAGVLLLVIGANREIQAMTMAGSGSSALALGAILYWRAELIAYSRANGPSDGA